MAKETEATGEKQHLSEINEYKQVINNILKVKTTLTDALTENPDPVKQFDLVELRLNLASYYMILTGLARSMVKKDNQGALDEARKVIGESIASLEDMVSRYADALYTDYEEKLALLEPVSPERRYLVIRKLGLTIRMLKNFYGDNSKWKWSFVDIEGRFATVTKNIFDMRNMTANNDPRSPHYEATFYHLQLIKQLLMQASERYRERYELSTNSVDDFRTGLSYLVALRRLHILLGESPDAEMLKKKIDSWSAKLEADIRRKEEEDQELS
ncbi:MAG: hypothetical protein LBD74_06765 [Spirochaetaceae bacterium]|jgi:hypothetical protein|nr:hypothetical protein [Spirochaetaceae bacterium]